jgi:hypothetical protein
LVERLVAGFDAAQERLAAREADAAGGHTRAYLGSTVTPAGEPADGSGALMAGILASLGDDREHLEPLYGAFARWQERLERDGIDPVRATLVRLAADGLWLGALLGLPPLDKKLARRVVEALDDLTRE